MPALADPRRRRAGLTLTETLIALSISVVLLGTVLPGFSGTMQRRHVEGAAAQFETDFAYARSAAVASQQTLRLRFVSDGSGSCYVIFAGDPGACGCNAAGASCGAGARPLRHVHLPADGSVSVRANVGAMTLDPLHGTVSPTGTVRFTAPDGRAVHQVVNLMGRVRSCSPAPALPGHAVC